MYFVHFVMAFVESDPRKDYIKTTDQYLPPSVIKLNFV